MFFIIPVWQLKITMVGFRYIYTSKQSVKQNIFKNIFSNHLQVIIIECHPIFVVPTQTIYMQADDADRSNRC